MDGLEKLSIVIPTYGRQEFVKRQIEYWSESTATVFIMDGSPQALLREYGEEFASNIRYIHSHSDFFSRMQQATKLIETPYVALLGDDDLFVKPGLSECIDHLERNIQIFGAVGRSMYFFTQRGKLYGEPKHPESTNYSETIRGGLNRLHNLYYPGKIGAVAYGVYREAGWKRAVGATYSTKYSSGYVYDTFLRTLLTYIGEIQVVEAITWLCSGENPPIKNQSSFNREVDLIDWFDSSRFTVEVQQYKQHLINEVMKLGSDSFEQAEDAVNHIVSTLEERYRIKANRRMKLGERVPKFLRQISPDFVKIFAKRFIPRRFISKFDWQGIEFIECVHGLMNKGISADKSEMLAISELVLNFHSRKFSN